MTSVMRAVPLSGPRMLRIGLVRSGRVVDERMMKSEGPLTVGRDERCDILLTGAASPDRAVVFEHDPREGYTLQIPAGGTARVALHGSLMQAEAGARIPLDDTCRGKLVLGEETILFGFVAAAPTPGRPQLPVSVRGSGVESIDWAFTVLAAMSFLLHFGGVGVLYSDWMDPTVGDEVAVAGLVESITRYAPPPEVQKVESDDGNVVVPATPGPRGERKPGGRVTGRTGLPGGTGEGSGEPASSNDALKGLSEELDRINIATVSTLDNREGSTAEVLAEGGIPTDGLEELARRGGRVSARDGHGLNLPGSSATVEQPGGARGNGLSSVGNTRAAGPTTAGPTETVSGPKPVTAVSPPQVTGGEIPGAEGVVAGMQPSFRRCYERGLLDDATMSGSVRVVAQVGSNGEVLSVRASPSGTVSSGVAECIAGRVRTAQFERPKNGAATLVIPVSLIQQNRR